MPYHADDLKRLVTTTIKHVRAESMEETDQMVAEMLVPAVESLGPVRILGCLISATTELVEGEEDERIRAVMKSFIKRSLTLYESTADELRAACFCSLCGNLREGHDESLCA